MSRLQHHTFRVRLTSAALGLGAVLALAGCSAGQVTETDTQVAAVAGGSGDAGGIGVRNATLAFPETGSRYPQGASAPLAAVLINDGAEADRLVQVSSTYAASVDVGQTRVLPSRAALHAYAEPTTPAAGQQPGQGPGADQQQVSITLKGLTQDITPGVTIPVTFVFEKAGPLTVQVPIGEDSTPRPDTGGEESHH
ncbi:copper chaperone PCu(A)C [Saccharopolyspora sp. NPDC047091]|uniref:copper chaperone PCu(A)C n=1 Tax=Saccharopolyspora sp. NPDC047091 TaxID=3155924 RepID=UPI0033E2F2E9